MKNEIAAQITVKGIINLKLFAFDGTLKEEATVENIVTNTGRQLIIDRLQGAAQAVADYVSIGTGSTSPTAADTDMEVQTARAQGTLSQPDAYTDRCVYTFAAGTGTGSITEAGRLNDPSAGTLMGRQTFTAINKTASDSLQVTYDFTYAAS